jgi:DNA repair ATPase RecN
LDDATRVRAIAELLGGAKITDTTLHHAQELLKQQGG